MRRRLQIVREPRARTRSFASIENAIAAVRAGQMVIVVDDESRENEGDLTVAAEKITPQAINFMAQYGRGLICLAMPHPKFSMARSGRRRDWLPQRASRK